MTTDIQFGRLEEKNLRDAWPHEAREFTPWLAENIEHLSEAIGIPLELTGTEVRVETFSADILARNPSDDTIVLIENQLEPTDHSHLGQIMTYLAGLNAQTVVWVASDFREPHLSAIRWLNEHTSDDFSFFAVRLRVVRIGGSPYAPIFEIVEKPNDWNREVQQKAKSEGAAYYDIKEKFWTALLQKHPELEELGIKSWRYANNYITLVEEPRIELSLWVGKIKSGVFVRSGWGESVEPVKGYLKPHGVSLEAALGAPLGPSGRGNHFLGKDFPKGHEQDGDWSEIMDWMREAVSDYCDAIMAIPQ
ncbi:hypothetical protein [Tateyamaria pelophila]|uniref:hypothetical protein n=1 Tax=Tateyamaria pelophila TaxID=328415 RepID=UPI001CBC6DE1|nr:hypothetical protein [Tateyamaria pelophila]